MANFVGIHGPPYSGKTSVSRFLSLNFGFVPVSPDEMLCYMAAGCEHYGDDNKFWEGKNIPIESPSRYRYKVEMEDDVSGNVARKLLKQGCNIVWDFIEPYADVRTGVFRNMPADSKYLLCLDVDEVELKRREELGHKKPRCPIAGVPLDVPEYRSRSRFSSADGVYEHAEPTEEEAVSAGYKLLRYPNNTKADLLSIWEDLQRKFKPAWEQ